MKKQKFMSAVAKFEVLLNYEDTKNLINSVTKLKTFNPNPLKKLRNGSYIRPDEVDMFLDVFRAISKIHNRVDYMKRKLRKAGVQ